MGVGTHHYEQGRYWPHVSRCADLPDDSYHESWGRFFEDLVGLCGIERFDEIREEGGTRFVSKILAHGGIPVHCLPDFFGRLLAPAVRSGDAAEYGAAGLIGAWAADHGAFVGVDQPVRRFLVYGGAVGEDFLGRCLDLAKVGLAGDPLPSPDDVGLPVRVVEAFASWLSLHPTTAGRAVVAEPRYHRPVVAYSPWAPDALSIDLGPQPVPPGGRATWTLRGTGLAADRIDATPRRSGTGATTRRAEAQLPSPFAELQVVLAGDADPVRTWHYQGLTADRSLLAFRPASGELLAWREFLPATDLLLIAPSAAELAVLRGDGATAPRIIEELPLLHGGWAGYRGRHVDLAGCSAVVLALAGRTTRIEVRAEGRSAERPHLHGGDAVDVGGPGTGSAYAGRPPELRLPLPLRGGQRMGPDRWRVRVRSIGGARPALDRLARADELGATTTVRGDEAVLDLAATALLGADPFGEFEVVARGPLGHDARLCFGVFPRLGLHGQHALLVPDDRTGPPVARLTVDVTAGVSVEAAPDRDLAAPPRIQPSGPGRFEVLVPGDAARLTLRVREAAHPSSPGQADIVVPLRRVVWAVTGLASTDPVLADRIVALAREVVDQAAAPGVVVQFPGVANGADAVLAIEDPGGRELHGVRSRVIDGRVRFPLRGLLDAARPRSEASLRVVATVRPRATPGPGSA